MLKNKTYKIFFYFLLLTSIVGCSEYLSELPDNRTIIDSPEKVSQLLTAAYPGEDYFLMAELMSDNADDKGNNNVEDLELFLYQWQDTNLEYWSSPTNYWNSCYEAISQANQALKSIEELKQFDLRAQKGEALLARAYAHFMLVNFWGKHYDPNTANSDLGVPYVSEVETVLIKKYKRNTVQEVYDLIERDLLEGLSLVTNDYEQPSFHFTKEAGYALATRFYTFKGDWNNAIKYASKVLINPENQLRDNNHYATLDLSGIRQIYTSSLEPANLLLSYPRSLWNRRHRSSKFGLSVDKIRTELFTQASNPVNKEWSYQLYRSNSFTYFIPKFVEYFRFTNQSAGIGQPYAASILLDIDEVILNRAEAHAMNKNYTAALNDINLFLSKKIVNFDIVADALDENEIKAEYPVADGEINTYYTLDDTQKSFVKAIAELKRRQFYHEGLRWFDIRRLGLTVTHELDDSGTDIVLEKNDLRKQLQIPKAALTAGLVPNNRN